MSYLGAKDAAELAQWLEELLLQYQVEQDEGAVIPEGVGDGLEDPEEDGEGGAWPADEQEGQEEWIEHTLPSSVVRADGRTCLTPSFAPAYLAQPPDPRDKQAVATLPGPEPSVRRRRDVPTGLLPSARGLSAAMSAAVGDRSAVKPHRTAAAGAGKATRPALVSSRLSSALAGNNPGPRI